MQAEKLELVRLILDTEDKGLIRELITLFKTKDKGKLTGQTDFQEFYHNFREAIHEIKLVKQGKTSLKTLNEVYLEMIDKSKKQAREGKVHRLTKAEQKKLLGL